ncbi:MAG: DNA polymerase III subunit delta [Patescibacteria group bacterium]
MTATKIKKKISAIQFWYGENQSLLQVELERWLKEFIKRHPKSTIERIERGEEEVIPRLQKALNSLSLFAKTKLVVLYDFASKNDEVTEFLTEQIGQVAPGIFVILVERGKFNAQNKLVKKLKKFTADGVVNSKEFAELNPRELESWIVARVKQQGGKISSRAVSLLASLVGNNFLQLNQEIAKLTAFSNDKEISPEAIELMVAQKVEEDIFVVIDAVGRRDFKQAIRKLEEQFAAGLSPQSLVGTLAWHLRVLWQVREYLDNHRGARAREIASELGLHPYVVNKTLVQIPYYTTKRLQILYQELSDLDVKLKSTRLEPQALFDLFLSRLATTSVKMV